METSIKPIDPIAFHLGSIEVHWYGLLIGTGVILAMLLAMYESEKRGLKSETIVDLLIIAIPAAIIGARLYYVIFEWSNYSSDPLRALKIWEGGLAFHGSLIGAIIATFIFTKVRRISFLKLLDIAAPSLILGQAIGRWGNFFNQEAFGGTVSRGFLEDLHLPKFIIDQMYVMGEYHHPTFLYESLWCFLGCIALIVFRKFNPKVGITFCVYLIWYSIARFFIESLRTDSLWFFGTQLRTAQVVSIVLILIAIAGIVFIQLKSKRKYLE